MKAIGRLVKLLLSEVAKVNVEYQHVFFSELRHFRDITFAYLSEILRESLRNFRSLRHDHPFPA